LRPAQAARAAAAAKAAANPSKGTGASPAAAGGATPAAKGRKLSNRERAELEALPARLETLEKEQTELTTRMADPAFFKGGGPEVARAAARLPELEAEIAAVYARWTELEG
jgi:ATP-binding cassette subfamily F protein uup